MAEYYEAICPQCDNIIEIDSGEAYMGNLIQCDNMGCFFEGTIDDVIQPDEGDDSGQVFFEKENDD